MTDKRKRLTTGAGVPVGDNQNSRSAGPRGPVLMEDYHLMERMAHFNRERVPERVVHAKGGGAYGTFTVTHDITKYTMASVFSEVGKKTEMFARFSTVAGEQGHPDTVRDPRGFALKFYTEEGNWDMVGNNTPVFFVRDPLKFQDFIHSQKRHPRTGRRDPNMMFDFWSLSPESLHQVMILMSDRGIPKTWRNMNGYSSHTYSMYNEKGERFFCKWHFKTKQGIENILSDDDGNKIAGEAPDFHRADLYDAIENGDYPKWRVCVQIMPEADAMDYHIHPFDLTKVWPHEDYPLIEVGEMELNRNPDNYFAEVEQAAFEPGNQPPGLGVSPDKMLQARVASYPDAHRYRIGINYIALPVNKARSPVHTLHRDGMGRFDGNGLDEPNYEPNSFGGATADTSVRQPPLQLSGDPADHYDHRQGNEDYNQPGELYRKVMNDDERQRLVNNLVANMSGVDYDHIKLRHIGHWHRVDSDLGERIAKGVGLDINEALKIDLDEDTGRTAA